MATAIALIGSGIFAKEEHLPAIRATPLLDLKAVYSRTLASAQALTANSTTGLDLYSDDQPGKGYDELLQRNDVVGVVIALPILAQPEYIKKALSAGKHVLAEKPIAKDVATASELLKWYHSNIKGPTFGIAENFRMLDSFIYASQQIASMGRLLNFRANVQGFVKPGMKYYETAWRKKPEYQGGFLLDGGVHSLAAIRLMLGETKMLRTSAFSAQLQEHLPPVDTINATVQLKNGSSGIIAMSFGSTFSNSEFAVACEKGTVTVSRGKVTVVKDGKEEVKEHPDEGAGVKQEIRAWAEALIKGELTVEQGPEEALRDVELLEAILTSGEKGGAPIELKY